MKSAEKEYYLKLLQSYVKILNINLEKRKLKMRKEDIDLQENEWQTESREHCIRQHLSKTIMQSGMEEGNKTRERE